MIWPLLQKNKEITDQLQHKHNFKLKGTGPLTYHLGCAYTRDPDGTIVGDPTQYIEKILESYERTFGSKPQLSWNIFPHNVDLRVT